MFLLCIGCAFAFKVILAGLSPTKVFMVLPFEEEPRRGISLCRNCPVLRLSFGLLNREWLKGFRFEMERSVLPND